MSEPTPKPVPPTQNPEPQGSPGMPGEVGGEGRTPGSGAGGDGGDASQRTLEEQKPPR